MNSKLRINHAIRWLGIVLLGLSAINVQAVSIDPVALNGNTFTQRLTGASNDIAFSIDFNASTGVWLDVLLEVDDDPLRRISVHTVLTNLTGVGWEDFSISLSGASWSDIGDVAVPATVVTAPGRRSAAFIFDPILGSDMSVLIGGTERWFLNTGGGRNFRMHLAPLALIPEPATSLLLILGLICLVRGRIAVPIRATRMQGSRER